MRQVLALFVWSAAALVALLVVAAGIPSLRPLVLFLLYSVPANSIIPLPHEPGLLYFSLLAPALPLAVAGAMGAFAAAYFDRWVVGWAVAGRAGAKLKAARSWQLMTRMLLKAPFATIFAVSLSGVPPLQAIRFLAVSAGYPTRRYALAVALGRLPRFYLIALLGSALSPPGWLMGGLTLAFVAWPIYLILRRPAPVPVEEES